MSELDETNRRLRADSRHPERATLTVTELAQVLGVGRSKIYDMIYRRRPTTPGTYPGFPGTSGRWSPASPRAGSGSRTA